MCGSADTGIHVAGMVGTSNKHDRPSVAQRVVQCKSGQAFRHLEPVHSSYRTTREASGLDMVFGDLALEQQQEHPVVALV